MDREEETMPEINDTPPPQRVRRRRPIRTFTFLAILIVASGLGLFSANLINMGWLSVSGIPILSDAMEYREQKAIQNREASALIAAAPRRTFGASEFVAFPETTVNLSAAAQAKILRMNIMIETDMDGRRSLEPLLPKAQDTVREFLSLLDERDLSGVAYSHNIRREIARRVNSVIGVEVVRSVLITQMVIQ